MNNPNDLLAWGPVSLVRRNHGLEHATLNLLAVELPHSSFAGHSDSKGFWIIGNVPTDKLLETANLALQRMKDGEHGLAVHQNCGTNYVTSGVIAGTLAWLFTLGKASSFKKRLDRWPLLVLIITGALIASQPLGPRVQARITTSGEPGGLVIKQIIRYQDKRPALHRIITADESLPGE